MIDFPSCGRLTGRPKARPLSNLTVLAPKDQPDDTHEAILACKGVLQQRNGPPFSAVILMAIIVPSYFIVVWIFPGLNYRPESRILQAIRALYTLALFAAVAVVALLLFVVGRCLTKTIKTWFWRDDA